MKDARVLKQDKTRNEGYTRAEIQAQIQRRAYQRFEQRGRVNGYALADWVLAEAEVLEPKSKAAA